MIIVPVVVLMMIVWKQFWVVKLAKFYLCYDLIYPAKFIAYAMMLKKLLEIQLAPCIPQTSQID